MANEERNPEAAEETGSFGRVVGAVVNPRSTFESIVRKPTWLLPVLLLLVINVVLTFSFSHRVGWRGFMEQQLARSSRYAQMSPVQQQQVLNRQVRIAPLAGYIGGTVGTLLVMLAIAGIFLAAFNIVFGSGIKFRQSLGITTHAFLPEIIYGLLGVIVVWVRPPQGVNLQNLVMSNVGAFLPSSVPVWLMRLGTSFDLFSFWTIALLAMGYTAASSSRKLRFGSALAVVVVIWLIYVVSTVGFTAVFFS